MTALVRTSDPEHLDLSAIEPRIDDAVRRGEEAFHDLAALVATVYRRDLWRQATVPIGPETEERRPCKSFVEWVRVCREKKKDWGYHLVKAHAFSTIVENEAQARELDGLTQDQARKLVDLATDGGTKSTTAAELRRLRPEVAIAKVKGERQESSRRRGELKASACLKTCEALFRRAEHKARAHEPDVRTKVIDAALERLAKLANDLPFAEDLERLRVKVSQAA